VGLGPNTYLRAATLAALRGRYGEDLHIRQLRARFNRTN
jgi:hypothetical protein